MLTRSLGVSRVALVEDVVQAALVQACPKTRPAGFTAPPTTPRSARVSRPRRIARKIDVLRRPATTLFGAKTVEGYARLEPEGIPAYLLYAGQACA